MVRVWKIKAGAVNTRRKRALPKAFCRWLRLALCPSPLPDSLFEVCLKWIGIDGRYWMDGSLAICGKFYNNHRELSVPTLRYVLLGNEYFFYLKNKWVLCVPFHLHYSQSKWRERVYLRRRLVMLDDIVGTVNEWWLWFVNFLKHIEFIADISYCFSDYVFPWVISNFLFGHILKIFNYQLGNRKLQTTLISSQAMAGTPNKKYTCPP